MALTEVLEVLDSRGQLLVLTSGSSNSAGIQWSLRLRPCTESQVHLAIDINTGARAAVSQEQCDPRDHSQSGKFCVISLVVAVALRALSLGLVH